MRVLVIGAGAIGQVFGYHLQCAGADLAFLVRPRQMEEAQKGYALYPLNRRASVRTTPVELREFDVFDDVGLALADPWDLIVLAMSSVALRSGDFAATLGRGVGGARLLVLQPTLEDRDAVLRHVPAAQVVYGMLAVISYQTPLPGDVLARPGVAYWFPWFSGIGLSGSEGALNDVVRVLKAGGMPIRRLADVHTEVAFTGAILDKTVTALQVADWSFARLGADRALLALAHRSMEEAWVLATATTGTPRPRSLSFVRPWLIRAILWMAPIVLPFDLERFFHYHYVKVMAQSLLLQDGQRERFVAAGLPCPATTELCARMRETVQKSTT